jgi:hypothetical protein
LQQVFIHKVSVKSTKAVVAVAVAVAVAVVEQWKVWA